MGTDPLNAGKLAGLAIRDYSGNPGRNGLRAGRRFWFSFSDSRCSFDA